VSPVSHLSIWLRPPNDRNDNPFRKEFPVPIDKSQRSLVVVNQLDSGEFDFLYRGIEFFGRRAVDLLRTNYQRSALLYDGEASRTNLVNALKAEGARSSVREIDLVVMMHGLPNRIKFVDGYADTRNLGAEIDELHLAAKLRLVYSTTCYGLSHADDFVKAGFTAAVGSRAVNANAEAEVPIFVTGWALNQPLGEVIATAQVQREALDRAAELFGRATNASWADDVNSEKRIEGNENVTITTSLG
jgi:hypothetical protein